MDFYRTASCLMTFAHSTVLFYLRPAETETMKSEDTYHSVQKRYGGVAKQAGPDNQRAYERKVATAFGYDLEDLRSIPDNANLGVSCGNPLATANIGKVGHSRQSPLILVLISMYRARLWLIWVVAGASTFC